MSKKFTSKVEKFVKSPGDSLALLAKRAERKLTFVFGKTAFFLQGQMDINPRSLWHREDFVEKTGGFFPVTDDRELQRKIFDLDPWDHVRRDMIVLLLRSILVRGVPGDLAELGVYQGQSARLLHHYVPERRLHLFDTFSGFSTSDIDAELRKTGDLASKERFSDTSVASVLEYIHPQNGNVLVYPGRFPDSVPDNLGNGRFALAHLDADLYDPTLAGLEFFYPRLAPGGFLLVHDYNAWIGARNAVRDYCVVNDLIPIPLPDKSGSALLAKPALN